MASQSGVLYIGMTNDLFCRVSQHKSKTIPGFSQTYNTTKLVYFEPFQDVRNAIAREKQLEPLQKNLLDRKTKPDLARPFPETNSHHKLNDKLSTPISTTSETCHPDRSNPTFSSHLTSREMVGLRSGGTSLLFPCVGRWYVRGWAGHPPLSSRPKQPNFVFPSHFRRDGWVAQWSDLSSLTVLACRTSARLSAREDRTPRLSHTLDRQKHEGCPKL